MKKHIKFKIGTEKERLEAIIEKDDGVHTNIFLLWKDEYKMITINPLDYMVFEKGKYRLMYDANKDYIVDVFEVKNGK
jgi:hypothetical protein